MRQKKNFTKCHTRKEREDYVDCSIEKIERFLTDYGRLTRINQMTYVSREHETKEEFYKMPHKKRKGRLL